MRLTQDISDTYRADTVKRKRTRGAPRRRHHDAVKRAEVVDAVAQARPEHGLLGRPYLQWCVYVCLIGLAFTRLVWVFTHGLADDSDRPGSLECSPKKCVYAFSWYT